MNNIKFDFFSTSNVVKPSGLSFVRQQDNLFEQPKEMRFSRI